MSDDVLPSLQGKVCLVTGASGAIEQVTATELAGAGAPVVAAAFLAPGRFVHTIEGWLWDDFHGSPASVS